MPYLVQYKYMTGGRGREKSDISKDIREIKFAIKLYVEEGREERARTARFMEEAEKDRKRAAEDRKIADEERKRTDERFERYERKAEKDRKLTMTLIKNLTRELTREGRRITERLTGIENILRKMSNGLQKG